LWVVPVEHQGNRNASVEEADVIVDLVHRLLAAGSMWTDEAGQPHQITPPTSASSRPSTRRSCGCEKPSTVELRPLTSLISEPSTNSGPGSRRFDLLDGDIAPEDAPRGMEFLYSLNRLNVATSRARCAAVIVASTALFEPGLRHTADRCSWRNALALYREMAAETIAGRQANGSTPSASPPV
jgi:uncharacterized protein